RESRRIGFAPWGRAHPLPSRATPPPTDVRRIAAWKSCWRTRRQLLALLPPGRRVVWEAPARAPSRRSPRLRPRRPPRLRAEAAPGAENTEGATGSLRGAL